MKRSQVSLALFIDQTLFLCVVSHFKVKTLGLNCRDTWHIWWLLTIRIKRFCYKFSMAPLLQFRTCFLGNTLWDSHQITDFFSLTLTYSQSFVLGAEGLHVTLVLLTHWYYGRWKAGTLYSSLSRQNQNFLKFSNHCPTKINAAAKLS